MKTRLLLSILFVVPCLLVAQDLGKVSGKVTDNETGAPLVGANVLIEGTSLGGATDNDGAYTILGVPVGTYTIQCNYIGYTTLKVSNISVSATLTSSADFKLSASAIEGDVVEVSAEKPIINKNSTNTTRIVDSETIENIPLRGVGSLVAMQTGTVSDDGNIYVRGSRAGDVAYYVDGVYMNNAYTLSNTSAVSNSAMEEVQFQSGGFSAEFGNVNGGVVNTTTRSGGNDLDFSGEFVMGLGESGTGDEEGLYSNGYNLYNFNVGGPLGSKVKYFFSYEGRSSEDMSPTKQPFYVSDRTEIAWSLDSMYTGTDSAFYQMTIGDKTMDWHNTYEDDTQPFNTLLETAVEDSIMGYDLLDITNRADTDSTERALITGYNNARNQYGSKPNSASDRMTVTSNVLVDMGMLRLKLGGLMNQSAGRSYIHSYSLVNSDNNPRWETNTMSLYANATMALSKKSYIKLNLSSFNYKSEAGDDNHWDNYNDYGNVTATSYLRELGYNPLQLQEFAYYSGHGSVYDDYDYNETSYIGFKGDYVNQLGNHELKLGVDWRSNTIKYYRLAQPMEIARELLGGETDDEIYTIYRNAYAENLGYSVDGKDAGVGFQDAGNPVILGAYFQDKIELQDLIMNIGVRYDSFNPNAQEATDWADITVTDGKVDKTSFKDVEAHTYINPRIGFSFPVSDKTKFHAQYGKFSQHPILNRLYLSDTRLASNLTQGNMTVSPNPSLKPERTTQYEVGFTQQVGNYAALAITGFYKEVRDYTMMANIQDAKVNGALFSWAQYMNGDYGVVKGLSFNVNMRRVNGLMANASYTLSFAEGTGSDPASNFNIAWTGDTYPTMINPLDYDQRHTGSVMVDYRLGDDGGLLSNTGLNLLYQFGSGTAYTPSLTESAVFGRGWYAPTAAVNSAYKPWTATLDLKLDRKLSFGGYAASAYLLVLNALDVNNVDEVYPGSGEAGNDGYLNTESGKTWATGNPDAVDFYNAIQRDPRNWDAPRQVRVGIKFEL